MVKAISQDLDELGFVKGEEYIAGPRNSGRTTRMLKDALHQLDFMDPGDEIWIVTVNWRTAKHLIEFVGNELAKEMGFEQEKFLGPCQNAKTIEGFQNSPDGRNINRYFLTFETDKHIHFTTVEELERTLRGRRLTYSPCIFFEHICYEFGAIQEAEYDLYALLQAAG